MSTKVKWNWINICSWILSRLLSRYICNSCCHLPEHLPVKLEPVHLNFLYSQKDACVCFTVNQCTMYPARSRGNTYNPGQNYVGHSYRLPCPCHHMFFRRWGSVDQTSPFPSPFSSSLLLPLPSFSPPSNVLRKALGGGRANISRILQKTQSVPHLLARIVVTDIVSSACIRERTKTPLTHQWLSLMKW